MHSLLDEYAKTFFALINSMYQIKAQEMIDGINTVAAGMSDKREDVIKKLEKSADGLEGILAEVRNVKRNG